MKRKSLLFTLLLALFMPWVANAQETLTVYEDGTATSSNVPVHGLWADAYLKCEFVVPVDQLTEMTGGTISQMDFYLTSPAAAVWAGTFQVFLMEVDDATISAYYGPGNATTVYEGQLDGTQSTMTVEFSENYTYGGSNLLVGVYQTTPGNYKSATFAGATVNGASGQGYNSGSLANCSFTQKNFVPKTTFTYQPSATGGCEMPEALTANGEPTAHEFSFTIEGGSGLYNIELKAGDADWTYYEYEYEETVVDLTDLEGNTAYKVRVQSVCADMTDPETGDAATSNWKTLSFTTQNPCATPTNLQITDITPESATLTWTPGYQETTWTVKYKKSTDEVYTEETVNGTPSITLNDLDALTTYDVQVYNCENYVSGNFTTAAAIPLTEAFATTSVPTGWTRYNTLLTDDVLDGTTTLTSYSGGWNFSTGNGVFDNHAKVNIYGTSCKYWLVTPTLLMEDNVQLTFDLALTAYSGTLGTPATTGTDDKFVVLIQTESGWEILRQWDNAGSEYVLNNIACSAIGEAVAIDLSSYAGQNIAVAFYAESTESNADNNLHIDNVSIDYIPACAKPTGLAVTQNSVTAHEATITWTSDAAAWQVQLNDEDPIDVEEATYTFENLDPETAYTAKVRANCDGTFSEWTTAVSFTTTIACPAPTALAVTPEVLSATFTWESNAGEWEVAYATDATADPAEFLVGTVNEATYTVNDLELGDYYFWVRANCGEVDGDSQWAGPASVHIGYCVPAPSSRDGKGITKVIFGMGDLMVNNVDETNGLPASSPFYGDYTSMVGAMQAGVESTISITYATGSGTVYSYGTIIWVDWDNSLSFEDSEIVYTGTSAQGSNGVPQVLEASFIVPADQASGEYRMRIAGADSYFDSYISGTATGNHSACFTASYAVCHDYTLYVLEAPSCLIPTGLAIDYTGGTEATISWTSDAEAWNMRVNGVDVNGVITNPYTLTGLELATTYSVEVQANCGEDGTSEWTNPVSFTTDLCMPEEMCAISYSFTDQYDDSWNQAYMNIVDATTGEVLYELTMPNVEGPYEGSFNVCDGREIQFVWVSGNYPRECGYTFTHNGVIILEKATNSAAPEAGVVLTYNVDCGFVTPLTKTICGYGDTNNHGGYYLIALPFDGGEEGVSPTTIDGMITDAFDLYCFDEGQVDEWINYNPETFNLVSGKGYLYASQDTTILSFMGTPIEGTEYEVKLHYTEGAQWAGWNLVGNPFAVTATIIDDYEFYTMSNDGDKLIPCSSRTIEAMEGIFVKAQQEQQPLTFTIAEEPAKSPTVALNLSDKTGLVDRAIVRFGESRQLPKFQLNPNSTKLYITKDNQDYAVVRTNNSGSLPVSFKPEQDGTYTINVNTENVNMKYLHLVDRMTGMDTDLLRDSYKFDAMTNDDPSRFILVYKTGSSIINSLYSRGDNTDSFGFFNNGNWIINNEGKAILQVIDVNGRILSSEEISGSYTKRMDVAPGVYILRLINNDNVKVQKVVVE